MYMIKYFGTNAQHLQTRVPRIRCSQHFCFWNPEVVDLLSGRTLTKGRKSFVFQTWLARVLIHESMRSYRFGRCDRGFVEGTNWLFYAHQRAPKLPVKQLRYLRIHRACMDAHIRNVCIGLNTSKMRCWILFHTSRLQLTGCQEYSLPKSQAHHVDAGMGPVSTREEQLEIEPNRRIYIYLSILPIKTGANDDCITSLLDGSPECNNMKHICSYCGNFAMACWRFLKFTEANQGSCEISS